MSKVQLVSQDLRQQDGSLKSTKGLMAKFGVYTATKETTNGKTLRYCFVTLADGTSLNTSTYIESFEKGDNVFVYPSHVANNGAQLYTTTFSNVRADEKALAELFGGIVSSRPPLGGFVPESNPEDEAAAKAKRIAVLQAKASLNAVEEAELTGLVG
jgi:hypothetical protein